VESYGDRLQGAYCLNREMIRKFRVGYKQQILGNILLSIGP
jgi:hypothetical protein